MNSVIIETYYENVDSNKNTLRSNVLSKYFRQFVIVRRSWTCLTRAEACWPYRIFANWVYEQNEDNEKKNYHEIYLQINEIQEQYCKDVANFNLCTHIINVSFTHICHRKDNMLQWKKLNLFMKCFLYLL